MIRQNSEVDFDFVIKQREEGPTIGIEVMSRKDITETADRAFREKLWRAGLLHGILVTSETVRIYEDLLLGDGPLTYGIREARAEDILSTVSADRKDLEDAAHFTARVSQWLQLLVENWGAAIPPHLTEPLISLIPAATEGELVRGMFLEDVSK